ncbi:sarcosine oxidase, gamma subunit family protein [Oceanicola granulosus HTCC2516]|uniref:Sarcosine oxidase, gamma subunit family protein n=1 Tax=Oceanicola granulosus (strain ATCC BAA-861 / DSM 15982 / KCTC 12143 / HTCC2516) TaxID=314256 RepID=Q2CHK4_OCEGH|nr:sarcosine oxidase subunit gamma family protein [Oceanicola granulosus]EAR52290.1 sarcosine oxidase, gamma subunit family protein [Oceanicola granulosus HTCC2516]
MSDLSLERAAPRGMIALRGDFDSLAGPCREITGADLPAPLGAAGEGRALLWMSPDELLLLCDPGDVGEVLARLGEALAAQHHLASDVSDARVVFTLRGPGVRDALARITPCDMRPGRFHVGQVRRTRLGQVAAAIRLTGDAAAEVYCFRSVGDYVERLLATALESANRERVAL